MATLYDYAGCCTASIVYDFSEGLHGNSYQIHKTDIENHIRLRIQTGHKLLVAITKESQKGAEKALKDCMFEGHFKIKDSPNSRYKGVFLTVWTLNLTDPEVIKHYSVKK